MIRGPFFAAQKIRRKIMLQRIVTLLLFSYISPKRQDMAEKTCY